MREQDILNLITELSAINNTLRLLFAESQQTNFMLSELYRQNEESKK